MQRLRIVAILVGACALAALSTACGSSRTPTATTSTTTTSTHHSPRVVYFYSSLPMSGASGSEGQEISDGIALAVNVVAQARAGDFKVVYRPLDANAGGGSRSVARAVTNARKAAVQAQSIFYIGDLSSAASAASIPVLNLADIPQLSPGAGYIGLTQAVSGVTSAGEPRQYYPAGRQTFFRLLPSDMVEAAAQLLALQNLKCARLGIADDGSQYGVALKNLLTVTAPSYGIKIVATGKLSAHGAGAHEFALKLKADDAECVAFSGHVLTAAVAMANAVHAQLPMATIVGSDGVCRAGFTNPKHKGVAAAVQPYVLCTQAMLPVKAYGSSAKHFKSVYRANYGVAPSAWALYGYAAARIGLDAVRTLGENGDNRADVTAVIEDGYHQTPMGTLAFDPKGNSTIGSYGLYKVGADGDPEWTQTLTPTKLPVG